MKKKVVYRGKEHIIETLSDDKISIDGEIFSTDVTLGVRNIYKVIVDRQPFTVEVKEGEYYIDGEEAKIEVKPHIHIEVGEEFLDRETSKKITAPIPGKIVQILVKENDSVTKNQELMILEAMKMRNRIFSPVDGVVSKIYVTEDIVVKQDQNLIDIEVN
ncbi:MAG: biotin/lipoyl-containing protein [Candidatus Heimdallarchaeaceae archaeon]